MRPAYIDFEWFLSRMIAAGGSWVDSSHVFLFAGWLSVHRSRYKLNQPDVTTLNADSFSENIPTITFSLSPSASLYLSLWASIQSKRKLFSSLLMTTQTKPSCNITILHADAPLILSLLHLSSFLILSPLSPPSTCLTAFLSDFLKISS